MKKLNRILNIYIFIIIIFLSYIFFVMFFEPYMYNRESICKEITNYSNIAYINGALENYMNYYFKGDIEAIKTCTVKNKVALDEDYNQAVKYISDNKLDRLYIKSIQKKFGDIYIITFYINSEEDYCNENNLNKCILKLNMSNNTFKVYYDSLVDKGE